MRDRIFGLLGIETGEESMVLTLLSQSVFLGVFFGSFDISAHSLFLSIFDEKMMARGYVVSGIAGIILTSLYTWLQTRLQFKRFAVANLFAVTLFTMMLWMALLFSSSKWVIFTVFIMLGPLNILAMLGFWGTAGRLFSLRQGKRLFGLVDSGLIVGIIISCYTIPILLSLNFASHNILLISASSVLVATVIQLILGSRFMMASTKKKKDKPEEKKSVLSVFRSDRYTRIMAIFVALSVVTAFFVQYSFMAVTREQYPVEEDMAKFLGIFTGSMMIFTLLVKLFAFSYLIRNYGLKTCLAVSPILVAGFTAIAILIGLLMGYTPEASGGFLIFFLILALSRLFSKSLKDSIESPSFKVIYQTIDEKIRYEVQSGMDGTVNEIAALFSGLLLAGLGILSFIKLIHFSLVLFFIILTWVLVAFFLYSEYRKSIRKALETIIPVKQKPDREVVYEKRFSSEIAFRNDYFRLITGDYLPLENKRSMQYYNNLIDYTTLRRDLNLMPVLKRLASDKEFDESIRRKSEIAIGNLQKQKTAGIETEKATSAGVLLYGTRVPQTTLVLRLFRDNSIESKRYAIYIIGKFKMTDLLPEVCEYLGVPALQSDAAAVVASFGDKAVKEMIRFYMAASDNLNAGTTILRALGSSRNEESTGFLFSRLWSNSRQLRETAAECLVSAGFKPSEEERDRLQQLISEIVGIMTWNLSAKVCLEKNNDTYLLGILNKDNNRWRAFLFNVLSITYDPGSIGKIRENLENETVESGNFALEMIDLVIDDSIKPKIIALLDIVPDEIKLKNLYHFFPGEVPSHEKLIESIINRDYNMIDLWARACTLRNLTEIKGENMAESVSALLFSPENILREEAARLIVRSDSGLYESVSRRIPFHVKEKLDRIIDGSIDKEELVFEKITFLSKCFKDIPEDELISLSGSMIYERDKVPDPRIHQKCIIWPLTDSHNGREAFIYFGSDEHQDWKHSDAAGDRYYFLPLEAVEEFHNHFPESSPEILAYIDKNEE